MKDVKELKAELKRLTAELAEMCKYDDFSLAIYRRIKEIRKVLENENL